MKLRSVPPDGPGKYYLFVSYNIHISSAVWHLSGLEAICSVAINTCEPALHPRLQLLSCAVCRKGRYSALFCLLYTADLLSLIEYHGFIYADDTQILGSCRPSASQDLLTHMSACIDEVLAWMRSNQLQLNTAKTEFLWSTTSRRLHQLPQLPLRVSSDHISPASVV